MRTVRRSPRASGRRRWSFAEHLRVLSGRFGSLAVLVTATWHILSRKPVKSCKKASRLFVQRVSQPLLRDMYTQHRRALWCGLPGSTRRCGLRARSQSSQGGRPCHGRSFCSNSSKSGLTHMPDCKCHARGHNAFKFVADA